MIPLLLRGQSTLHSFWSTQHWCHYVFASLCTFLIYSYASHTLVNSSQVWCGFLTNTRARLSCPPQVLLQVAHSGRSCCVYVRLCIFQHISYPSHSTHTPQQYAQVFPLSLKISSRNSRQGLTVGPELMPSMGISWKVASSMQIDCPWSNGLSPLTIAACLICIVFHYSFDCFLLIESNSLCSPESIGLTTSLDSVYWLPFSVSVV